MNFPIRPNERKKSHSKNSFLDSVMQSPYLNETTKLRATELSRLKQHLLIHTANFITFKNSHGSGRVVVKYATRHGLR